MINIKRVIGFSLISGLIVFLLSFIFNLNGVFYGTGIERALLEDYPGYIEVLEDYGKNNYEADYEGFTPEQVIALETLYNRSYRFKDAEMDLQEKIKAADPFKNGSNRKKVLDLEAAVTEVQVIKNKYYEKLRIIDSIIQGVGSALWVFIVFGVYEVIWGRKERRRYAEEKDNRVERNIYPSKEFFHKPKA